MTRNDFLAGLEKALSGLSKKEKAETLSYYEELIADSMENGMPEDKAIASLGNIQDIANTVLAESRGKNTFKPRNVFFYLLLILGSPLWISLLCAAFSLILTFYVILWALLISLWSVTLSFGLSGGLCLICGIVAIFLPQVPALPFFGSGSVILALGLFLLPLSIFVTKKAANFTSLSVLSLKRALLSLFRR